MLATKDIYHSYSRNQNFQFPDLHCDPAGTLLIIGQSGVGKTTLLHILAGILKPSKGQVIINNEAIYDKPSNGIDLFRGQNIGLVFQKPHFVQALNAKENLLLAQRMAGTPLNNMLIDDLLGQLNIGSKAKAKVNQMSQGEQQRLSIARALVNNPKVILADEPTSALDDRNCEEVVKLLKHQASSFQAALIIVTHDMRLKEIFPNQVELN